MAPGVPADVLSEIICTVGEIIRGCRSNQEFFGQVMASTVPPRSALVLLLMSMVNEKQPISLRTAVLYCFQCYLYKNDISQGQIVQALLPTSMEGKRLSLSTFSLLTAFSFSFYSYPECYARPTVMRRTVFDRRHLPLAFICRFIARFGGQHEQ